MRIIGGEYRSLLLVSPKGMETRPTLDATRESLFNILAGRLENKRVLDLFAGSGALGLEALSRGAMSAVFCDNSKKAAKAVISNIKSLKTEARAVFLLMDWSAALQKLASGGQSFDLIFLDPPYVTACSLVVGNIAGLGLLAQDGLIVLERSSESNYSLPQGLALLRTKQYRHTCIDFIGHLAEETNENSHLSGKL